MTAVDDSLVAVIGLAGRFPGAATVEQFWANVCDGVETVVRIPELDDPTQPQFTPAYGMLERSDEFDADFFGYSPAEALIIDPQQRVFLECAYEALERAGHADRTGRPTVGVFAGGATTDYRAAALAALGQLPMVDEWLVRLATAPDFLATRVAHKLGLSGPAVAVQTACSTSLVAVHLAVQALLSGECDLALAGGATVHVPYPPIHYTEGGILAPDGHTRAFDADAEGGAGGSAAAVVVLRPLADAIADGDHIHAVLRGSAVNNDGGEKVGFTAPSVAGQAAVIRAAHLVAEVDPDTITYVEAHGTGTRLGDPIEVAALTRAFRAGTADRAFCALGSVKTNIGHTDAAAGAVGLIKAVLAVEHGVLPPSLNFRRANPELLLDDSPFVIADALRPWRTPPGMPRRAGVSALGVGGTNAHVIVEQPPPVADRVGQARPHELVVLSARTPTALDDATEQLAEHLVQHEDLDLTDVAWTLRVGRPAHAYRRAVVASDTASAVVALRAQPGATATSTPDLVFLFPGQGAQHIGMAAGLYHHEQAFREPFDECAELAAPELGVDLRTLLFGDRRASAAERLATMDVGQPAVFAVEYALAMLLRAWGVRPAAVVGHSLGAYAAACVAGVLELPDALRLVVRRGALLGSLPAGAMLAVRLPPDEVQPMLPPGVSVAAVNGPGQCTVAGAADLITALAPELAAAGLDVRTLSIATAGHSPLVEPVVAPFLEYVAGLSPRPAALPVLSDTTGTWADPAELARPEYWATHLRAPVRFDRALSTLADAAGRVLVEVGPGRTLSTLARQHPATEGMPIVQSLPHPLDEADDLATALAAAGRLWTLGVPVDWRAFDAGRSGRRVILPTYPFQRSRYLIRRPDRPAGATLVVAESEMRPAANSTKAPPEDGIGGTGEILRSAFRDALGLAGFGADDDFFDAGGDSLVATRLAGWLRDRFQVPVTPVDIIRGRTVTACARLIDERLVASGSRTEEGAR